MVKLLHWSGQSELEGEFFFNWGRMIRPSEACRINPIFRGLLALIFMVLAFICYIIRKICESSFQRNKQCLFWTSELGVMASLVEAAQAVGGCARMKEDSSISPPR